MHDRWFDLTWLEEQEEAVEVPEDWGDWFVPDGRITMRVRKGELPDPDWDL